MWTCAHQDGDGFDRSTTPSPSECTDGIDNDNDGDVDVNDADCIGPGDQTESPDGDDSDPTVFPRSGAATYQDGIDQDCNGFDETELCDGADNDGDGLIDEAEHLKYVFPSSPGSGQQWFCIDGQWVET